MSVSEQVVDGSPVEEIDSRVQDAGADLRSAKNAGASREWTMTLSFLLINSVSSSGLTKGFLSKLERDQTNASVASLIRLCDALEISVASLFEAPTGEVVRADVYPRINFGGEKIVEYLLTPRDEQRLQAILSEIEPGGGSGEELYSLPAEVEFVLVLAGRLEVRLQDRRLLLDEGDALTFTARSHHGFRNPATDSSTRVLWVFTPALPPP